MAAVVTGPRDGGLSHTGTTSASSVAAGAGGLLAVSVASWAPWAAWELHPPPAPVAGRRTLAVLEAGCPSPGSGAVAGAARCARQALAVLGVCRAGRCRRRAACARRQAPPESKKGWYGRGRRGSSGRRVGPARACTHPLGAGLVWGQGWWAGGHALSVYGMREDAFFWVVRTFKPNLGVDRWEARRRSTRARGAAHRAARPAFAVAPGPPGGQARGNAALLCQWRSLLTPESLFFNGNGGRRSPLALDCPDCLDNR